MTVSWVTPVDVTPGSTGAWTDVDLDTYVAGLGTDTGVAILRVENQDATTAHAFGLRKNGSTDNRTNTARRDALFGAIIGVDSGNIFECYIASTSVKVFLVGYATTADAKGLTNGVLKSVGSGAWTDIDISADTGADTAIAAVLEWTEEVAYGQRQNGSTDNRVHPPSAHAWWMTGCDGSEILEIYRTSGGNNPHIVAYFMAGVTMNTNATDRSLGSTDVYTDITLTSGAGGIIEVVGGDTMFYGIRKNGSAEDVTGMSGGHTHGWFYSEADSSSVIEGKINNLSVDFFEVGVFNAGAAPATTNPGWMGGGWF